MADCDHDMVTRGSIDGSADHIVWTCVQCADQFVHVDAIQQLEAETNGAIDMACAMFANIIRALYNAEGKPPPDDVVWDCEEAGHMWGEDGRCVYCKAPKFLGG